ncbi:MAG: sensor histidine kinase, partial [Aquificae bacterium]|nr:sensor histidine kinase [Aquificota bacterium]
EEKDNYNLLKLLPQIEPLKDQLQNVLKQKKRFETTISSNKKGEFVYHIKAFPMKIENEKEFDSILILIEDITRKEELETHVIQTEKLAILGRLVAGLSHDIRNPLAAISQAAFRIKKLSQKIDNEKLEQLAKVIEKNVERSTDIMGRLLNFSKPAYQKTETISLKNLLEEALELSLVKKHQVTIEKNIENDIYVYGDKNALIHGIVNLIINSLEAMNYKGKLYIKLYKKNNNAIIEIKDSGKGIPNSIKDKIFEPFFTTKDEGTGLGLFVLQKVIKEHRGKIDLITEQTKGTTFIIELPTAEEL